MSGNASERTKREGSRLALRRECLNARCYCIVTWKCLSSVGIRLSSDKRNYKSSDSETLQGIPLHEGFQSSCGYVPFGNKHTEEVTVLRRSNRQVTDAGISSFGKGRINCSLGSSPGLICYESITCKRQE